jgi:uncharacterized protein
VSLSAGPRAPGRPGVFAAPAPTSFRLRPERLDVAGFVGVALRGPVDEPVPLARWSEYEQLFGGFERPAGGPERLLPHAVSAFFRQGGQLAYVLRLAPPTDVADPATATFRLRLAGGWSGPVLAAADEGTWGNALQIRLRYEVSQQATALVEEPAGPDPDEPRPGRLSLPAGTRLRPPTLVRLRDPGLPGRAVLRWVVAVDERRPRGSRLLVELDAPLPLPVGTAVDVDVVTGALDIDDDSAAHRPGERLTGLGLHPGHPRYLFDELDVRGVPAGQRHLVRGTGAWASLDLTPGPALSPVEAERVADGADRSHLVDRDAFFDPVDADVLVLDEDTAWHDDPHVGVDRMARVPDLGLLCVPDLTWRSTQGPPAPPAAPGPRRPAEHCCSACDQQETEPAYELPAAVPRGLDARRPDDLAEILARQQRVVETARVRQRFVALIDVPDGLSAPQVAHWRSGFDSSYAAAYHPWLAVAAGREATAIAVPPSAFAAGIIADRELRLGLPWGPANELARDAVRAEAVVTDAIHDQLHGLGINVFRVERDGFRLTAGRTLSSDPDYRQLSVRRLMTMLRLSLEAQTQWLAFEPNTAELRERLARVLTDFLRTLERQGAFAGRTEADSFFVRCGDDLNPGSSLALGRLIAEVGVAPTSPLEYVMVRIARDVDGSLSVVSDER